MAQSCFVSGDEFVEDERVVSQLVRRAVDGEILRFDMKPAVEGEFETPGPVACRWVQAFKPRTPNDNPDRELKLTAENLFLTLAAPDNELSEADARLVQFLALMLERKRMIKSRGRTEDRRREIYEHRGSKIRCEVPVGELTPEFFMAVQEQLSVLVGAPEEPSAGTPEEPKSNGVG